MINNTAERASEVRLGRVWGCKAQLNYFFEDFYAGSTAREKLKRLLVHGPYFTGATPLCSGNVL